MALKVLIKFPTTYECKSTFNALLAMKPKTRNQLNALRDMRIALSITEPSTAELIATKKVVVVAHIYPPVTGQRQTLNIGRSAHFLLQ